MNINNIRLKYFLICIVLFLIEAFIAIFVHDNYVRPYLGDIIVVFLVYSSIRVIFPYKFKFLGIYCFIFSVFIELLQLINILDILNLSDNIFLSIIIGSVFDIKDIICYGIGGLILLFYDFKIKSKINL